MRRRKHEKRRILDYYVFGGNLACFLFKIAFRKYEYYGIYIYYCNINIQPNNIHLHAVN